MGLRTYTQDAMWIFNDPHVITLSGPATIGGSQGYSDGMAGPWPSMLYANDSLERGPRKKVGPGRCEMVMILDIHSIKTSAGDELYTLIVQGSQDVLFSSSWVENLAARDFGAAGARPGGAKRAGIGRYELYFSNNSARHSNQVEEPFKFIRMFTAVSGTAPSISFTAWAAPISRPKAML